MTRLDRIEEQLDIATSHIEGPLTLVFTGQDLRYMVRVIRELVKGVKLSRQIEVLELIAKKQNTLENVLDTLDAQSALTRWYLNLPDEVRELIISD